MAPEAFTTADSAGDLLRRIEALFPASLLEQDETITGPHHEQFKQFLLLDLKNESVKHLYGILEIGSSRLDLKSLKYGLVVHTGLAYRWDFDLKKWELVYYPGFSILDPKWYQKIDITKLPLLSEQRQLLNARLKEARVTGVANAISDATDRMQAFKFSLIDPKLHTIKVKAYSEDSRNEVDYEVFVQNGIISKIIGRLDGNIVYELTNKPLATGSFEIPPEDIIESEYAKQEDNYAKDIANNPNAGLLGFSYRGLGTSYFVVSVINRSPANKAGIEIGDQILEVNNQNANRLDEQALKGVFAGNSAFVIKLKKFNGLEHSVSLKKARRW